MGHRYEIALNDQKEVDAHVDEWPREMHLGFFRQSDRSLHLPRKTTTTTYYNSNDGSQTSQRG